MFPFKSLQFYKVKKNFVSPRSSAAFEEGRVIMYIESTLNHNEGIEICTFRDSKTNEVIIWHADEMALENWTTYFEIAVPPKL